MLRDAIYSAQTNPMPTHLIQQISTLKLFHQVLRKLIYQLLHPARSGPPPSFYGQQHRRGILDRRHSTRSNWPCSTLRRSSDTEYEAKANEEDCRKLVELARGGDERGVETEDASAEDVKSSCAQTVRRRSQLSIHSPTLGLNTLPS